MLRSSDPCDHVIQAYSDDGFLATVVADYVGTGLGKGEGAVVIATAKHVEAFGERLAAGGHDVRGALAAGNLLFLDAEETLARITRRGRPDRTAFLEVVAAALDHVRACGSERIRLYGEMVELLWRHDREATVELEELWNEVLVDPRLSLLCAYRLDPLDRRVHGVLHQVTRCHRRALPVEDYERFEAAVHAAYAEVFGVHADATALRELMVARVADVAMPPAQAAMLALQGLPGVIVNDVYECARHRYHGIAARTDA